MKLNKFCACAALIAGTLGLSTPSQAVQITGGFHGTFKSGTFDTYGFLGTTGADLSGLNFTALINYDTSATGVSIGSNSVADYNNGNTFMTSSITLGNAATPAGAVPSDSRGALVYYSNRTFGTQTNGGSNHLFQINYFLNSTTNYADYLLTTQAGFDSVLAGLAADSRSQGVQLSSYGAFTGVETLGFTVSNSFGAPPTVPEPTSIALFGIGLLGLLARRRKQ